MRIRNVFILAQGKIEYTDIVKQAVLNPRITGLKLNCNGGWDWIDQKYGFLKLLLSRGQISEISTGQDLLAHTDYLNAAKLGCIYSYSIELKIEVRKNSKKSAYASEKRILAAREKFQQFKAGA